MCFYVPLVLVLCLSFYLLFTLSKHCCQMKKTSNTSRSTSAAVRRMSIVTLAMAITYTLGFICELDIVSSYGGFVASLDNYFACQYASSLYRAVAVSVKQSSDYILSECLAQVFSDKFDLVVDPSTGDLLEDSCSFAPSDHFSTVGIALAEALVCLMGAIVAGALSFEKVWQIVRASAGRSIEAVKKRVSTRMSSLKASSRASKTSEVELPSTNNASRP